MEYVEGKELERFNKEVSNYEMIDEMAWSKILSTDFTDKITLHEHFVEIDSRFSKEEILKELSNHNPTKFIEVFTWERAILKKYWFRVEVLADAIEFNGSIDY